MRRDDIDALLGGAVSTSPPAARKPEPKTVGSLSQKDATAKLANAVSIPWLMKAFRLGRSRVQELLRGLEPVGFSKNGGPFYDLAEAASYLVIPKHDLRTLLKNLKPSDLPLKLQEGFWNSKLKEQKWRVNAGDLWPSASVMEVFGEAFKTIKSTVQLWTDSVEEETGINEKQRQVLNKLSDELLDELHKALILQAKSSVTESQLAELDRDDDET